MTTLSTCIASLREQRRATLNALAAISDEVLTAHVGPHRPMDVRHTLLALAQDDDARCAAIHDALNLIGWHAPAGARAAAALTSTRGQLRAVLVGLPDALLGQSLSPEEWPVRQTIRHLLNNEERFISDGQYAAERIRGDSSLPVQHPDSHAAPGSLGADLPGGMDDVLNAMTVVRDRLVGSVAGLDEEALAAPMVWAGIPVTLRFMLERRATHERQHTVQIRKTLRALGWRPSEAQMLLGEAEIARGALEGALIGVPEQMLHQANSSRGLTLHQLLIGAAAEEAAHLRAILAATG